VYEDEIIEKEVEEVVVIDKIVENITVQRRQVPRPVERIEEQIVEFLGPVQNEYYDEIKEVVKQVEVKNSA